MNLLRLSKLMTQRGLCSRREADELISKGLIRVNGVIISALGSKVCDDSEIEILTLGQEQLNRKVSLALNKPPGYVSNLPEKGYRPAIELITDKTQQKDKTLFHGSPIHGSSHGSSKKFHPAMLKGLAVAGRLDIDSRGLLILTQDGVLAKKIIGESSEVEKEYIVQVKGQIKPGGMELLNQGLHLDGQPLKKADIRWIIEGEKMKFILRQGKKRQIRRMCEQVGLEVVSLLRTRVGEIRLGRLKEGHWRFINPQDL